MAPPLSSLPGVESAEEEDDQAHDALGVPPLHRRSLGGRNRRRRGSARLHQAQQAGVTLPVCAHKHGEVKVACGGPFPELDAGLDLLGLLVMADQVTYMT